MKPTRRSPRASSIGALLGGGSRGGGRIGQMCGSFGLGNTAPTSQDFRRSDGIMGAGAPAGGAFQNEHRPAKDTRKSGLDSDVCRLGTKPRQRGWLSRTRGCVTCKCQRSTRETCRTDILMTCDKLPPNLKAEIAAGLCPSLAPVKLPAPDVC